MGTETNWAEGVQLDWGADSLRVAWRDGRESVFQGIWLRDNCPCTRCRDEENGQRLFDIAALPDDIVIEAANLDGSGKVVLTMAPEGHGMSLDLQWLRRHSYDSTSRAERRRSPRLWDASVGTDLPTATHGEVAANPTVLAQWLSGVLSYGVGFLSGVPIRSGEVARVAELFGNVRVTNYGHFFDVQSVASPNNLAYTGMGLGLHTDNPYREPVPGLQLLHCFESAASGGVNIIADGFQVAERLRREAPHHFEMLTRWEVPFRFEDDATELIARGPIIGVDAEGALRAVRYNSRSAWTFDLPADVMPAFYEAYRHFGRLLQDPQTGVRFQSDPGDLFIVDNRRVLHGRTGFTDGKRHLQGCYTDFDGLESFVRRHAIGPALTQLENT